MSVSGPVMLSEKLMILGVAIDVVSLQSLITQICQASNQHQKLVVTYANVHTLNLAYENLAFRDLLNGCDIVFCDGFGVKLAAQILYRRSIERFTAPDWIPQLAQEFSSQNLSMFFLGARPGVANRAAEVICSQIPGTKVVGVHHGHFNKIPGSQEQQAVIDEINRANPDLLVLGFGMPAQQIWVADNLEKLNVKVILIVGAMFDFLSGEVTRAPRWMTDHGLEWLGRLVTEPGRLWQRYLVGNPLFLWRVFLQKIG